MKKFIPLLTLLPLLMLASCEDRVAAGESLTEEERAALRARNEDKCREQNKASYDNFKNKSTQVFSSSAYERGRGFAYEFKTGNDVKKKADIKVWKQDVASGIIYFYISENPDTPESKSYFLKITKAENDAMIDDLYTDHCKKTYVSSTGASGPLSVKYEYKKLSAPDTYKYTDSYSFPFDSLAYFASYRLSRSVQKVNSDNQNVGTATSSTSSLTAKTFNFENYTDATDSSRYTQQFCEIKDSGDYRLSNSSIGYELDTCANAVPGDWDLSI